MTDANAFLTATPISANGQIVEKGDVALLLKASGDVHAITFGYDRNRLLQPSESWTEEDHAMIKQGQKLFALAFAAGHPKLMQMLLDISADPEIVDMDALVASATRH